jgi:hypothetical protein
MAYQTTESTNWFVVGFVIAIVIVLIVVSSPTLPDTITDDTDERSKTFLGIRYSDNNDYDVDDYSSNACRGFPDTDKGDINNCCEKWADLKDVTKPSCSGEWNIGTNGCSWKCAANSSG